MKPRGTIIVTGEESFIGRHLVTCLKQQGYRIRGGGRKNPDSAPANTEVFEIVELRTYGLIEGILFEESVHEDL